MLALLRRADDEGHDLEAAVELHQDTASASRKLLVSATLIDLVLGHEPIEWMKGFGNDDFGAYAMLRLVNVAWLRIGLFGGGFGVSLDDFAEAKGYVWDFDYTVLRAGLRVETKGRITGRSFLNKNTATPQTTSSKAVIIQ